MTDLYAVEGSNGSLEILIAWSEESAIETIKIEQGRPEGVSYTATVIGDDNDE